MTKKNSFIWSDNWWIEDSTAWFVDGEKNILFWVNLSTNECNFVAELPITSNSKFRMNPRCIKCGNEIICMPDIGESIWIYNLVTLEFQQIEVNNPDNVRLSIVNFWRIGKTIFAVSIGLRQIIEMDIGERRIVNYYSLTSSPEETIALSIKNEQIIYSVSSVTNKVYAFDFVSKKITVHVIPNIIGGIRTICYDGKNFWLSGYKKEIYIWEKESNRVEKIEKFPLDFGIYNFNKERTNLLDCISDIYDIPTFFDSVAIGQDIWFIPYQTNKIIYVNMNTYETNSFEIQEEEETEDSLGVSRRMSAKYLLEAVVKDRYLLLYSLKNGKYIEINVREKKIEERNIQFSQECLMKITQRNDKSLLYEYSCFDKLIYEYMLLNNKKNKNEPEFFGDCIYREKTKI